MKDTRSEVRTDEGDGLEKGGAEKRVMKMAAMIKRKKRKLGRGKRIRGLNVAKFGKGEEVREMKESGDEREEETDRPTDEPDRPTDRDQS